MDAPVVATASGMRRSDRGISVLLILEVPSRSIRNSVLFRRHSSLPTGWNPPTGAVD
jgi:hypothetical protein